MAEQQSLLVEIGTEEIPPGLLQGLLGDLATGLEQRLAAAQLTHGQLHTYATPRRLAVWVEALATQQPDRQQTRRGPALQAAFDAEAKPTRAAEGFARSCGVTVEQLQRLETDKGAWLVYESIEPGQATATLIPAMVEEVLGSVPLPKRMRWGDRDVEFIRPVHWVVLLLGDELIPGEIMGLRVGRETRGHRFHHPSSITINHADDYVQSLLNAWVMVDMQARRERIREQVLQQAVEVQGQAVISETLLDEVNALVEWPVALRGEFEARFLDIPSEVLITTMQENQRYFPVVDAQQGLMPYFVTVANLESRDPAQVIAGNQRVLRPRFSDAEFFWNQDRQRPLADRVQDLRQVVFQQKLGSLHDRSERIAALARSIAPEVGAQPDHADRAGWLAKCDLITDMVQEFPELQGVMGQYYAQHDGEHPEVAAAILEQYQPRHAGDELPASPTGQALALADRLDTLVGSFAIGQQPSGNRDPFGLRRAALGVLRILCEQALPLNLYELLERAAHQFPVSIGADAIVTSVFDFIIERFRGYLLDRGVAVDVFEAVLAVAPRGPLDFQHRVTAVSEFRNRPEVTSLAGANKRIRNILRKVQTPLGDTLSPDLFTEEAERRLAEQLAALRSEVEALLETARYDQALDRLATLREPVDHFFDEVMVMADDEAVRANRLALLKSLGDLFLGVADLSRLQG